MADNDGKGAGACAGAGAGAGASDPKTKALKISDTFLKVDLSSDSTPPMLAWPAYVIAS